MKKVWVVFGVVIILGGCTNSKYPNWEYVRIEHEVLKPSDCVYKIQEACSARGADCYNWYKQRATIYGANTVVLVDQDKDYIASHSGFTGNSSADVRRNFLADYYYCKGEKNIVPPPKN